MRSEAALFGIDKLNVARSEIPAVTHVDYSRGSRRAPRDQPALPCAVVGLQGTHRLPSGHTSFNVRASRSPCTPEDAFRCFMGSEIEVLVAGDCFLRKEQQDPALKLDYRTASTRIDPSPTGQLAVTSA